MNTEEARSLLAQHLNGYRTRSYADLVSLIDEAGCGEISSLSGLQYQLELVVLWDDAPGGNIRVMLSIDDGTFRAAFKPLTESFIKAPDGAFVGES